MVGAADVDRGPTEEQLVVIAALASGYYEIDVDPAMIEPLDPRATADAFADQTIRRRVRELLVLSSCAGIRSVPRRRRGSISATRTPTPSVPRTWTSTRATASTCPASA